MCCIGTLNCVEILKLNLKDSCLVLKKTLKLSFMWHLCDKCDDTDDDIVACDDKCWYHLIVFLLVWL